MAEHIQTLMRRLFFGGGRPLCVQNVTSVMPERPQGPQTLTSVAPRRSRCVRQACLGVSGRPPGVSGRLRASPGVSGRLRASAGVSGVPLPKNSLRIRVWMCSAIFENFAKKYKISKRSPHEPGQLDLLLNWRNGHRLPSAINHRIAEEVHFPV